MNRKITKRLLMERAGLLNENTSALAAEVNNYIDLLVKEYKEENDEHDITIRAEKLDDSYKGEDLNLQAEGGRGYFSIWMSYLSDYDSKQEFDDDRESEVCFGYVRDGKLTKDEEYYNSMNEGKLNERVATLEDFIELIKERAIESDVTEEEEAKEIIDAIADHYKIRL